jgi:hypothetical protein
MEQTTKSYDPTIAGTQHRDSPAEAARHQAGEVASTVTQEAAHVATTAKDGVVDLTGTVKEQVSTVTSDVADQGRTLLAGAKEQVASTADDQVSKVSGALGSLSDQLTALIEGRPEEAGQVRDLASRARREVEGLAGRIDQKGVDGVLDDVRRFARRRPGTFLLLAGAAGLGVGLVARGAKSSSTTTEPSLPPLPPIAPAPQATGPWPAGNGAGGLR